MSLFPASRRLPALALGLAITGFAAAACGVAATSANPAQTEGLTMAHASAGPVRCELVLDEVRGSTTIEGRVTTDRPVSGTYRMSIMSRSAGGSAVINQSGDFAARPGAPTLLGQTTLGGSPAGYRANLELTVAGQRQTCTDTLGARDL
jgi:hypothetical protein